jgi:hypothetical protein
MAQQGEESSGVASGQVEATEDIELRYVASSSFTRNICFTHKNTALVKANHA